MADGYAEHAVVRARARLAGPWQDVRINDGSVVAEPARAGDPQERLQALQRRAFAADGDAAGDAEVARAIRDLQTEIAATGATSGRQALAGRDDPPDADARPGDLPDDPPGVGSTPDQAPPAGSGTDPHPVPRRRRPLVVALSAALALGVLLGSGVTAALQSSTPSSPSAASETGTGQSGATETDAPADQPVLIGQVFARMQTPRDVPLAAMPETFIPETFRYLGSAGWTDADADGVTDSPYYAVRGGAGVVCLVVVPNGTGYLSTCAVEAAYPEDGLRLSWQSTDLHPAVPDGSRVVLDITVAWLSNAMVETRGSGRPVAAAGPG
jgi:hypothetical protein